VHRIGRAFGLQPHRAETFKLSRDPQFVAKVRDIVGLVVVKRGLGCGRGSNRTKVHPGCGPRRARG
jgi:hypothetical protein